MGGFSVSLGDFTTTLGNDEHYHFDAWPLWSHIAATLSADYAQKRRQRTLWMQLCGVSLMDFWTNGLTYQALFQSRWMAPTFILHDDVIKWKYFPHYWPFVRGIHRSPVNFPHKGQWREASMFSLIWAWINGKENNRDAGDLRCHCAHYGVIVIKVWIFIVGRHQAVAWTNAESSSRWPKTNTL